ncbi:precorrin-8X methylmutase [Pseudonocardia sp.]|uniref:precorrin-8X methylmutase n=1 Tax=Pseudonocardia sp. TaxID=60912 RepID=UPI003D129452
MSGPPRAGAHPIEVESYAILRARLDVSDLPPLCRAVVERIVHTTADASWAGELVCDEAALRAGQAALRAGAPLVTDVRMVAAGITAYPSVVALDLAAGPPAPGDTRSAAGIREAVRRHPVGAVWAIGNAPTALAALVEAAAAGLVTAPLVVGLPVGFVGAVGAKAALRASRLGAVSSRTERGGAAVAAAAVNALLYAPDPAGAPS